MPLIWKRRNKIIVGNVWPSNNNLKTRSIFAYATQMWLKYRSKNKNKISKKSLPIGFLKEKTTSKKEIQEMKKDFPKIKIYKSLKKFQKNSLKK